MAIMVFQWLHLLHLEQVVSFNGPVEMCHRFIYSVKLERLSKNGSKQCAFIFILAADLSNYHYQGRTRGYLGGGGPVSSPVTGGVTTGPHRPTVFRTGWE